MRRFSAIVCGLLLPAMLAGGAIFYLRPLACYWAAQRVQMRFEGVRSREIVLDGHRVHYFVDGPANGLPVVLVHGLGGRAEDWAKLAPYLASAGFRVYMPDLLGYGLSDRPADFSYSVSAEADLVVQFVDALKLNRFDLGGWSMGGWIAQEIAIHHPERVRRLMLFDSVGLRLAPEWDTRLFTPNNPAELAELNQLLMPNPPSVPAFVARDILRFSKQRAWVIHRALATMLAGTDTTDSALPGLKMPVLLVWGGQDQIAPVSEGREMHRLIRQSRLAIAEGCGHLAPGQCATMIASPVLQFLKGEQPLPEVEAIHPRV